MQKKHGSLIRASMAMAATVSCLCAVPFVAQARADDEKATAINSGLVNITTPDILAPRQMAVSVDVRVFGNDDKSTFVGPSIRLGYAPNWEFGVNSALSQFRTLTTGGGSIKHGGTDVELTAKYATRQSGKSALSYQLGMSLPHTPTRVNPILSAGIAGSWTPCKQCALYINPRAVFMNGNPLVGLGFGGKLSVTHQISLIADYTSILGGVNTVDLNSLTGRSHDIAGAAVRFTPGKGNMSLDLGWTNGTGSTTGFSLSPGLGYSGAFYFAVNLSR